MNHTTDIDLAAEAACCNCEQHQHLSLEQTKMWETWKQGFNAWEQATAQYMEKVLTNPGVLGPAGSMLTVVMKTKAATDRAVCAWWAAIGLPTRRDQERALHKLNQLESRLYDLEERLR